MTMTYSEDKIAEHWDQLCPRHQESIINSAIKDSGLDMDYVLDTDSISDPWGYLPDSAKEFMRPHVIELLNDLDKTLDLSDSM